MKSVWKFPLPELNAMFIIQMPKDARPLTVQVQNGEPYIWALVDPNKPMVPHKFRWAGTGQEIANAHSLKYLGTFQMFPFVWHLFDLGE